MDTLLTRVINASLPLIMLILPCCNPAYEDIQDRICNSLHPIKPISRDIRITDYCHGEAFRFPYNSCTEMQCHAPNLRGGNSGAPSCYKCHGDKWTLFSTTHTLKLKGYYHDPRVDMQPNMSFPDCALANCHGLALQGIAGAGYSCTLCHTPIPPPGHRSNQEGARHHFNLCLAPHLTYCGTASCHGTDANLNDGAGTPCSNCHSVNRTCD